MKALIARTVNAVIIAMKILMSLTSVSMVLVRMGTRGRPLGAALQLEIAAVDVRTRASSSATIASWILYLPYLTSALFPEAHRRRCVLRIQLRDAERLSVRRVMSSSCSQLSPTKV
jgi:hypothetical protein